MIQPSSLKYAVSAVSLLLVAAVVLTLSRRQNVPAFLQSSGNIVNAQYQTSQLAASERLKIESSIQKAAEHLEHQIPVINHFQTAYQKTFKLEDTDEQADHILQENVKALAETSVAKRTSAVIDMAKASQELQVAALHQRIASVMADKSEMLRGHSSELKSETGEAAAQVKHLQSKVASLQASAQKNREDADADLLSAQHLLKSAKQVHKVTTPAVKQRDLGKRLDKSLVKARQLMEGDTRALARAEWKLNSLKGYEGTTDAVSRIAEDIESNDNP